MKGKVKEVNFSIVDDRIPTVNENLEKGFGRWCKNVLGDRRKGPNIFKQAEDGLRAIDKTSLSEKVWCL